MRSSQFNSGNYNSWDKLVRQTLPEVNNTIRHTLIPKIDAVLDSMLGGTNAEYTKDNIDVSQNFEANQIVGVICEITYIVDDFQVADAPRDAIDTDIKAITDALKDNKYDITKVDISTSDGKLTVTAEIDFEDNEDDKERLPQNQG
jgi:hypothetical protein